MKIGIYKIGKPIYFQKNEEDHASWSIEVINVMKILKDHGHTLWILSENDYKGDEYHTPKKFYHTQLDVIYVWNGATENDSHWDSLFDVCDDVRLILTDMALTPPQLWRFSKIYTQSDILHTYGAIETSSLYQAKFKTYKKSINFYFGGTERGRTWDFLQYVYRPDHLWYGKSDSLGIKNYIPFHEHIKLLKKTKYTIVIGDKAYNEVGFVTPRYYENLQYGVLPFVDDKFDQRNLIPIHPFLRVHGYVEMRQKMTYLDLNPVEYKKILKEAIDMIPAEYISGEYLYNQII